MAGPRRIIDRSAATERSSGPAVSATRRTQLSRTRPSRAMMIRPREMTPAAIMNTTISPRCSAIPSAMPPPTSAAPATTLATASTASNAFTGMRSRNSANRLENRERSTLMEPPSRGHKTSITASTARPSAAQIAANATSPQPNPRVSMRKTIWPINRASTTTTSAAIGMESRERVAIRRRLTAPLIPAS